MTMVPPPHRIPAASILMLGKIAISHVIVNHNTAIQFLLMISTISLFIWLFSTGGGAEHLLTKGEFFESNFCAFSAPLHHYDAN